METPPAQTVVYRAAQWDPTRRRYWHGIGVARYVARKVFRIIDDQARKVGLEPLEHQVLLQIHGSRDEVLHIGHVAERVDIPAALASRVVRALDARGLVHRSGSPLDKRITEVRLTDEGRHSLYRIDGLVRTHVGHFSSQLEEEQRITALSIFALYVGASSR